MVFNKRETTAICGEWASLSEQAMGTRQKVYVTCLFAKCRINVKGGVCRW